MLGFKLKNLGLLLLLTALLPACIATTIRGDEEELLSATATPPPSSKRVYISHNWVAGPQISVCGMNTTTGSIESCQFDPFGTDGGISTNGSDVQGVASVTLSGTQYVYFEDKWNQTLYVCTLATDFYAGCVATGQTGVWFPTSMEIKEFNGTTYAYVGSEIDNLVYQCTVASADGTLGGCVTANLAMSPQHINFDDSTGVTLVYVAGFATWKRCTVNTLTGAINTGACSFTAGYNGVFGPMVYSSIFATVNGTRHAYYGEGGSGNIFSCDINSTTGELTCVVSITGIDFSAPTGLAVNDAGTKLYVVDNGNGAAYTCDIKTDGTIDTCLVTDGGIAHTMVNRIGVF